MEFLNQVKQDFLTFLDPDMGEGEQMERIRQMITKEESRLRVNVNDLRSFNEALANRLLENPADYLPPFDEALKDKVGEIDPLYASKASSREFAIGLEGSFGIHAVTPRGLSASLLNHMVMVEGIVTKCSVVRPRVRKSVHYCPATNQFSDKTYRDVTDLGRPTSSVYPTKDDAGNALETEYGLCIYHDRQTLGLQEMPERAPPGQIPRGVEVIVNSDLVDHCKPGDRVQIVGIYRSLAGRVTGGTNGFFKTRIVANNIRVLGKDIASVNVSENDIKEIRKLAKSKKIYDLMAGSLAPSIFGHEYIKRALLLMLLGGREHNLASGTHIRGDINVLMVGDPSTAKSQLLRFVMGIAPLAISTTGRGSSGVGLTAAVTTDQDSGEKALEAGAMVLADRGVVCIDEFDKMNDTDRTAIHEVMEQQTVTIAKAGIHTQLNARCSVVAAANPAYGMYNRQKAPVDNIALPDSLLSRFDLLFIVLDTLDVEHDRAIAAHVLRSHRYKGSSTQDTSGTLADVGEEMITKDPETEGDSPVYQKYNKLLHGARRKEDILSIPFIRKYCHYAKKKCTPTLDPKVVEFIQDAYVELRGAAGESSKAQKTLPVTARTLETLIRLSTAHAKLRLSNKVVQQDAEAALDLMRFALYQDVQERGKKRPRDDDDDDDDDDNGGGNAPSSSGTPARKKKKTKATSSNNNKKPSQQSQQSSQQSVFDFDDVTPATDEAMPLADDSVLEDLSVERIVEFRKRIVNVLRRSERATIEVIRTKANENNDEPFTDGEIDGMLKQLESEDKVMYREGVVFLI